ncbi:MAG: hypothetical protein K0S34_2026 [Bacillales bacterium]|jgi:hypothetical protein|nr:hypothetical protein [Bacillales bacterium]
MSSLVTHLKNNEYFSLSNILISFVGWLAFWISLVFIPLLFGVISLLAGYLTIYKGKILYGTLMMLMAMFGTVVGLVFSVVVVGSWI